MSQVIIGVRPNASQRTKNRWREHAGSVLRVTRTTDSCQALGGVPAVMVVTVFGPERNWFGWLPVDEVVLSGGE